MHQNMAFSVHSDRLTKLHLGQQQELAAAQLSTITALGVIVPTTAWFL